MILPVLSALAEPTRLGVIALLADGSEHCVCELMERLGATQSRMSRHMQVLRQAGLVIDRRDAQWVRYRLTPDLPPDLAAVVAAVLAAREAEDGPGAGHRAPLTCASRPPASAAPL